MRHTPNFSHRRAVLLHRPDSNTDKLVRQLKLLGLIVEMIWEPLPGGDAPDIVLVDADQGWDGLLPWKSAEEAPCPVVALLGTEAPSRIAWALEQGAGAILAKPINPSAVFPALVMAHARHEERIALRERMAHLEERLKLRPVVHAAVKLLMQKRGLSEEDAYAALRSAAMQQRQTVEAIAAALAAGTMKWPETG